MTLRTSGTDNYKPFQAHNLAIPGATPEARNHLKSIEKDGTNARPMIVEVKNLFMEGNASALDTIIQLI